MSKEQLIYASLQDYEGNTLDKMTKQELKTLLKNMMNEADYLVTTISQEAQHINPEFSLNVAVALALVPLVCFVDKYIQPINPKAAKPYRKLAMNYIAKLTDLGLMSLEEEQKQQCSSCKADIIILGSLNQDQIAMCTLCTKRVSKEPEEIQ